MVKELYFTRDVDWYDWLLHNHKTSKGVYLIFYKTASGIPSMRWEEAVRVALCFGWIDSTVKSLDNNKRRQYFCPRKPKSVWSALNKQHITYLIKNNLMHTSGLEVIEAAKKDGSWYALDDVENLIIPSDLKQAFSKNKVAYNNYQSFAKSYKKGYLYWLNQAKRAETRQNRITTIIKLCEQGKKTRM